ncbi:MAG: prolipoprotein diacylglyceryl transferase [Firmicutes bacterium]|nr:prolipoprotein diacylglyceryl transferase [Bacillota bacterium]
MNPIAFELGPLRVHWYGIIIAVAVAIGLLVARRLGKRFDYPAGIFEDFLIYVLPVALIGARLYYVAFNWAPYAADPARIIAVWEGGLAIHGAVLAAILVALWFCRRRNMDFFRFVDIAAGPLILGQAIGRWANYVNQEAYGTPTDLPWAMYIAGEYRHPTFLYESLWNLLIFGILVWYLRKQPQPGRVFAMYLIGYSIGRFFIEGLRTDSLMLGPLRIAQVISIAFILIGIGYFVYTKRRREV